MTIEITLDKALKALDEAVAEKGREYVYPIEEQAAYACQYLTREGKASCIVGNVLLRLGVPVEFLPQHGAPGIDAASLLDVLRERGILTIESEAIALLEAAQAEQDNGTTWGRSAHTAVEMVEERRREAGLHV